MFGLPSIRRGLAWGKPARISSRVEGLWLAIVVDRAVGLDGEFGLRLCLRKDVCCALGGVCARAVLEQ